MSTFRKKPIRSEQENREAILFTARRARLGIQTHPVAMLAITVATPFGVDNRPLCLVIFSLVTLISLWRWIGSNKVLRERSADSASGFLWLSLPTIAVNSLYSLLATMILLMEGVSFTSLIVLLGSVALVFGCLISFGLLRGLGLTLTIIHLFPPFLATLAQPGRNGLLLAILFIAFFLYILRASKTIYDDYWNSAEIRQRLQEAHAKAERANRVKDQFLANMGHEIRTPLNGIVGPVELILSGPLEPEQRKYAQLISSSASTLAQLIDDLLDFSKIEAGKLSLKPAPLNPALLLQEVIARHQVSADKKRLALELDADHLDKIWLLGDALRIGQIIENLLTNAIKFTEQGSVKVKGRCVPYSDKEQMLTISIEDSGSGIAPELQSQIFQPFVQADTSFNRRNNGTGLGLSICKRLADMMGGSLHFTSSSSGTRFEFKLPLASCLPPTADNQQESTEKFSDLSVLVAEDNAVNQTVIRSQLESLHIEPEIVGNGAEAVLAVQQQTFDLIILDCQMPVVDGYEAARQIRALGGRYRSIPIIALSAHALNSDVQAALAAGMNAYINKPASIKTLSDAIAQWTVR